MSVDEAILAVKRMIRDVQAIRAERWLREWPDGHPERPQRLPTFVQQYLADQRASIQTRT